MILQLIQHSCIPTVAAGSTLTLHSSTQSTQAYPIECYEEASLCLVPFAVKSSSIQTVTLNQYSWPSLSDKPVIATQNLAWAALSWAILSQLTQLLILELPLKTTLKLIPSKYIINDQWCLPYELASLQLAEQKSIICRCIAEREGCILSLDKLLKRWQGREYILL